MLIKAGYPNLFHGSDFLCVLVMNKSENPGLLTAMKSAEDPSCYWKQSLATAW